MYKPGYKSCEAILAFLFLGAAVVLLWRYGQAVAEGLKGAGYTVSTLIFSRTWYKRKMHALPGAAESIKAVTARLQPMAAPVIDHDKIAASVAQIVLKELRAASAKRQAAPTPVPAPTNA